PRPDERHITYRDVRELSTIVKTEFNIEGNPVAKFINLVMEAKPAQVTLVPDAEDAITSNAGWNTIKNKGFLQEVIQEFKNNGIRTSIFVDPDEKMVEGAAQTGTDRIELYTEDFAVKFAKGDQSGVEPYTKCAELAHQLGLGINAGHDLSLDNIKFFNEHVPHLDEVSIGHALIAEALYMGLEATIKKYLELLK
ncbi:MAG TPA: pyridoxine 5'-phosphate synthase, partial [Salegentibacter sp.]|nr:pyridoxine 5'-phosphate synthase [Salegentibacter sp.]